MDPLEPVADCGTTRNRSRNEEKDKAFSSLFEALSAGSPFSEDASSSSSPSSFSSASTTTTARDSHVSNAEMQSQVIERERKKGSREERNERKEDDKIRLRENDVQEQEGSSSHIAFWEEVENSLPDYVVGTYYSSDHIIWNIPPPPFEATFYGSAESGETI